MKKGFFPEKPRATVKPSAGPKGLSVSSPHKSMQDALLKEPTLFDYYVEKKKDRRAALEKIIWVAGHKEPISQACRDGKYTIAIRETGALSIKRVAQGARPKPHTILEKSIKDSSLEKIVDKKTRQALEVLGLNEYVGVMDEDREGNPLFGLRINLDALKAAGFRWRGFTRLAKIGAKTVPYVSINPDRPGGGFHFETFKYNSGGDWQRFLYPDSDEAAKEGSLKVGTGIMMRKLEALDLLGFVGHWSDSELLGVRIGNDAATKTALGGARSWSKFAEVGTTDKGEMVDYVPVRLDQPNGGPRLQRLKRVSKWQTLLYTGDYDLHEVYGGAGGGSKGQIMEASKEKIGLLNDLNAAISKEADPTRIGKAKIEHGTVHVKGAYAMFQHGDQATYQMNQILEAKKSYADRKLVKAVASESDEPIAWCVRGDWYVTYNIKEHREFRMLIGKPTPSIWLERGQKGVDKQVAAAKAKAAAK